MALVAGAGLVSAAACANSTFDPTEDSGAAGSTGIAGTSGASGSAGSPGKGGTSGASGASGKGGTSGASGASGKGGAGQAGAAGSGTAGAGGSAGSGGSAGGAGTAGKGGASGSGGAAGKGGASGAGAGGGAGKGGASGTGGASGAAGASGKGGSSGAGGSAGTSGAAGAPASGVCVYDPDAHADQDACFGCWNTALDGEKCKDERAACEAEPACAAFFQCVVTCTGEDSSCEKTCAKDTSIVAGQALYDGLRGCITQEECSPACDDHATELLSLDMCKHDVCTTGMILYKQCSEAALQICTADATCCGGFDPKWSSSCVAKAEAAGFCPNEGCVHSPCAPGAPIVNKACSPCVGAICEKYPHCCEPTGKWDATCAGAVATTCADL